MVDQPKIKNNVIRLLESRKIAYSLFSLPPEKKTALETAILLNIPPETMYKTIVLLKQPKNRPILAVIPANSLVDTKKVAEVLNQKKVQAASLAEAEQTTGLQTGGISPLALINKGFETLLDESASKLSQMHLSAGKRGMIVKIAPLDLISLTNARVCKIAQPIKEIE